MRRHHHELAAAVLDRAVLDLVVLAFGIELDAGADADIVGDIGGADGVGQRLRIGRTGALIGVGGDQQRLERVDVIGVQIDAGIGLGQRGFEHLRQLLVRIVPRDEAHRTVGQLAQRLEILVFVPARPHAQDRLRRPALLDQFPRDQHRIVEPADDEQRVGIARLGLRHFDGKIARRRIVGDLVERWCRAC